MEMVMTGQCHCGEVAYQAQGPILHQGTCTCRACQKATGTLASPNIGVKAEHFKVVQGTPKEFVSETKEDCDAGVFHFCANCGSQLYWTTPEDKGFLAIFVGTLDDPSVFNSTE
jgi:hypothetical protein